MQGDVEQRVRDGRHPAFGDQRQKLGRIVIVHLDVIQNRETGEETAPMRQEPPEWYRTQW
jgi:hypothetical protein